MCLSLRGFSLARILGLLQELKNKTYTLKLKVHSLKPSRQSIFAHSNVFLPRANVAHTMEDFLIAGVLRRGGKMGGIVSPQEQISTTQFDPVSQCVNGVVPSPAPLALIIKLQVFVAVVDLRDGGVYDCEIM